MKILLILPARQESLWRNLRPIFPPLNLAVVAALTPPEHRVKIVDEGVETIDFSTQADLVGISAITAMAPRAYEIAGRFRERGIPVVMGGMHPSAMPDEALKHCDAVVIGEAEGLWPRLLEDFQRGAIKKVYSRSRGVYPEMQNLPLPRRDLWDENNYLVPHTVQTTRGCPFSCHFCAVTNFFGNSYRFRPVAEIVDEVKKLNSKLVAFVDDNIVGDTRRAKELFRALIPLKIKWFSQGSLNMAQDDELLKLAAQSGCVGMFVGLESLAADNLKSMGKKFARVDWYQKAINKIHSYGIGVEGAFIFGFDHDDPGVFARTVRFAKKVRLELAQFGILTPLPGTPLFKRMEEDGRITSHEWHKYDIGHVVMQPARMSAEALQKGCEWSWQSFYSLPSIFRRLLARRSNLKFLLAANLAARGLVRRYVRFHRLGRIGES